MTWNGHWSTFIDGLLHLMLVTDNRTDFRIPMRLLGVRIDPTNVPAKGEGKEGFIQQQDFTSYFYTKICSLIHSKRLP